MNEIERTVGLYSALYDGDPWIDVNIVSSLNRISAQEAARKPINANSIWQIVNHMVSWRRNVLLRLKGEFPVTPPHNYFEEVTDLSEANWLASLSAFRDSQQEWIDFLQRFKIDDLDKIYSPNNMSYSDHIYGILQHDAYHLGQIVIIAKQLTNQK